MCNVSEVSEDLILAVGNLNGAEEGAGADRGASMEHIDECVSAKSTSRPTFTHCKRATVSDQLS